MTDPARPPAAVIPPAKHASVGTGLAFVVVGAALGVTYAVVSAYWAAGGTALLGTVGGSLEREGKAGGVWVHLALWAVVVLKLVAAALPALAIASHIRGRRRPTIWRLTQLEAVILTGYGFVLTAVGLLVEVGLISHEAHADRRALAWHAFLWDPWFLVWGLAVAGALYQARAARTPQSPGSS